MIEPTNGRVVLYVPYKNELLSPYGMVVQYDENDDVIPLAAEVVAVWGPRMVNLLVTDANGNTFRCLSRTLLQDDDAAPQHGGYAHWMSYQKGQAAKYEALKTELDAKNAAEAPTPVIKLADEAQAAQ